MADQLELLSPIKIGAIELANRVVMAPLTRGRAGRTRVPNHYMKEYYEMRASAGLIISEATAISDQGFGYYGAPGCYTIEHAQGWKEIVDAVHAKNGKIVMQLWHMGRQCHSSHHEVKEIVAPSAIPMPYGTSRDPEQNLVTFEMPRALETDEVASVVQDYVKCATLAKEAGFDGVEIHGANGYLVDEFLQSCSNQRSDRYGGSVENRYRFLKEVLEAVGKVYSYDRIGVRLSPNGKLLVRICQRIFMYPFFCTGSFGGMGSADNFETFIYVARQLNSYGLAYLHIMDGLGFGWHDKAKRVRLMDIKRVFDGPVMGNCGYTKDTAEGSIRSGAADLIAFGRPFLSNPDLVERFANNWPLNPIPPRDDWYGRSPEPSETLQGYLTYQPYNTTADK